MEIQVNLKQISKRRQSVVPQTCTIEGTPATVRDLILAQSGKVSFGINYGDQKADLQKARDNAIQCFEDGIYRIFLDDEPLESLDAPIKITKESTFTFVKLTMLSGRMW